jgi:HSP20 family molecular chaperone IbpA
LFRGQKRRKEEQGEYGKFVRRFGLPNEFDAGKAQAEFKDGALNVQLPKSPTAKPKSSKSR